MAKEPLHILFTNVGRRVALVRAFREAMTTMQLPGRILGVDANPLSPAYYVTDRSWPMCPIHHEEYIPSVLELCRREDVKLVMSLLDTDLLKLAESTAAFAQHGIVILISSPEVIRLARHKRLTHDFFTRHGIPTPRLLDYDTALAENSFPLFIKPVDGSASHQIFRLVDRQALMFFYSWVPKPLLMEYVSGDEYTLDLFIDRQQELTALVPRKRLEVRAGEVSKSQIVHNPDIIAAGRKVAQALAGIGALGVLNLQCLYTPDQEVKFIEINPRFGGGCPLSIQAGYPFPQWAIETALGVSLSPVAANLGDGLTMLRYDDAIFVRP